MSNSTVVIGEIDPNDTRTWVTPYQAVQVEPFAVPGMAGKLKLDIWTDSEQRERLAITPEEARQIANTLINEAERVERWVRKAEYLGVEPEDEILWRAATEAR